MKKVTKYLVHLLLGFQWGDEGKGKNILELLMNTALGFIASIRYQGGANAGHSLDLGGGNTMVTHVLPSGCVIPGMICLIGNDVVIDPHQLNDEIKKVINLGFDDILSRLKISGIAPLVHPYHKLLDKCNEWEKSKDGKIGSTLKGIGPAYTDFFARESIRVCDIFREDFWDFCKDKEKRFERLLKSFVTESMPFSPEDGAQLKIDIIEWHDGVEFLKKCTIVDLGVEMRDILTRGNILAEGAQGVMLDVRFGDYPYVTSSSTIAGGIFSGASIGLDQLGTIYAVIKPYPTKVGGGPFPSRILEGKIEEAFRECGGEFGASTGRPRFIGAPDFVQLRYALKLHEGYGKIQFIISKTDSFPDGVGEMPVIVKYKYKDGTASNELRFPLSDVVGVETQKCKSWKTSKGLKTYDSNQCFGLDLFINQLSNELFDIRDQYEIYMIGTGPAVGEYFFYPKV